MLFIGTVKEVIELNCQRIMQLNAISSIYDEMIHAETGVVGVIYKYIIYIINVLIIFYRGHYRGKACITSS